MKILNHLWQGKMNNLCDNNSSQFTVYQLTARKRNFVPLVVEYLDRITEPVLSEANGIYRILAL